jgi:Na+/H+ antiporter NhaD/arsenite permease-like protein
LEALILIIFVIGYIAIAFEHPLKVNKAASALLAGVLTWTVYIVAEPQLSHEIQESLAHHVAEIAQILFFLLGAMTIVELVDVHGGFEVITNGIRTKNKVKLLWIIGLVTFFMSAVLDNLTTAIVMVSLLSKLIDDKQERMLFAGIIVIAANSGGAWSPIGDVTTTMLWIGEKISPTVIIINTIVPSLVSLLVPLGIASLMVKGEVRPPQSSHHHDVLTTSSEKTIVLLVGLGGLIFVPAFKLLTHLPPFMGMMLSLGLLWIVVERLGTRKDDEAKNKLSPAKALERIDTPSVLFFLGILLAVGGLQVSGLLTDAAHWLDANIPNRNVVNLSIGLLSAVVDNVPLVAGAIEMYPHNLYPELGMDAFFWQFLAFTAGTGGSILIIGSAAGVATMGLAGIEFFWYVKRVSLLALAGFTAGALVFLLMQAMGWLYVAH